MTTTPTLPGRTYREVGVVVSGCYPFKDGPSQSPVGNAYGFVTRELEQYATRLGCNAVIDLHIVMGQNYYIILIGTGIQLEGEPPAEPPRAEEQPKAGWFRPWMAETWDFLSDQMKDF